MAASRVQVHRAKKGERNLVAKNVADLYLHLGWEVHVGINEDYVVLTTIRTNGTVKVDKIY